METKDVILELRKKNNLSQDEMAEKVLSPDRQYPAGKQAYPIFKETALNPHYKRIA